MHIQGHVFSQTSKGRCDMWSDRRLLTQCEKQQ